MPTDTESGLAGLPRPRLARATLLLSLFSAAVSSFAATMACLSFNRASAKSMQAFMLENPQTVADAYNRFNEITALNHQAQKTLRVAAFGQGIYEAPALIGSRHQRPRIVEFFDYRCNFCKTSFRALEKMLEQDAGLSVAVRQLPILSPLSKTAAAYSYAALDQGKFVPVHRDLLSATLTSEKDILAVLKQDGIDVARADKYIASAKCRSLLAADEKIAKTIGLGATPTFIVNGVVIEGWKPDDINKALSNRNSSEQREQS